MLSVLRGAARQGSRATPRLFGNAAMVPARCYPTVLKSTGSTLCRSIWSGARRTYTTASKHSPAELHWSELTTPAGRGPVTVWLFGSCAVVFGMVILGGVTRLTHSGLSMVEWKVHQLLPPMNDEEWEEEFNKYKQFPEYKELHPDMVLHRGSSEPAPQVMSEFKPIFWFEYGHRALGRAIGVLFAVPATYFAMRGYIKAPLAARLGVLFCMGGTQGAIGWWMVKSGLEDNMCKSTGDDNIVRVSPYRLASHLLGAFTIYAGLLWTGLSVMQRVPYELSATQVVDVLKVRRFAHPVAGLIGVTAISGAFVAGMKAGHHYNTFPLMDGKIFPERYWELQPWHRNLFENVAAVQFDHRVLAITTAGSVTALALYAKKLALPTRAHRGFRLLLLTTAAQVGLGITTLLYAVPVSLGAAHQAGALTLFSVAIYSLHVLRLRNPALAWQRLAQMQQRAAKFPKSTTKVPTFA